MFRLLHLLSTLTLLLTFSLSYAEETFPKYEIGRGAKYLMEMGKDKNEIVISFVEQTSDTLVIEMAMQSMTDSATLQVKMLQQFHLKLEGGKIKIAKGIMKIPQIEKPQILPPEFLEGYAGVQMKSFLINSTKDLDKKKVKDETVVVDGKSYKTSHYTHTENGQTVEYWISDAAKPLGLVKMNSQGGKTGMTYTLNLKGEVSNVKAEIEADKAVPLSAEAKMFLPLLSPGMFNMK